MNGDSRQDLLRSSLSSRRRIEELGGELCVVGNPQKFATGGSRIVIDKTTINLNRRLIDKDVDVPRGPDGVGSTTGRCVQLDDRLSHPSRIKKSPECPQRYGPKYPTRKGHAFAKWMSRRALASSVIASKRQCRELMCTTLSPPADQ